MRLLIRRADITQQFRRRKLERHFAIRDLGAGVEAVARAARAVVFVLHAADVDPPWYRTHAARVCVGGAGGTGDAVVSSC